jgi:hypothetical protein
MPKFHQALEGNTVEITPENDARLPLFCDEFGFKGLTVPLSMFQPSASALEERWRQSEWQITELRLTLSSPTEIQERTMVALGRFKADVALLKKWVGAMVSQTALPTRVDRAEPEIACAALEVGSVGTTAD